MFLPLLLLHTTHTAPNLSRTEFADRCRLLKTGISKEEVRNLLGKPDEIWTMADPRPFCPGFRNECWGWGTRGHYSLATRGRVTFGENGRCGWAYCALRDPSKSEDVPRDSALLPGSRVNLYRYKWNGEEITSILRDLDAEAFPEGRFGKAGSGSLQLIRAANRLIPLGEIKALAALSEYEAVTGVFSNDEEVFIRNVVFCLYSPDNTRPARTKGKQVGAYAKTPQLPQAPTIEMEDCVPFDLAGPFTGTGPSWNLAEDLTEAKKFGAFRKHLLTPRNDPILDMRRAQYIFERVYPQFATYTADKSWTHREGSVEDLFHRAIATAVDPAHANDWSKPGRTRWDPKRQCYVKKDGKSWLRLPLALPPVRHIEALPEVGSDGIFLMLRRTRRGVVTASYAVANQRPPQGFTVNLTLVGISPGRMLTVRFPESTLSNDIEPLHVVNRENFSESQFGTDESYRLVEYSCDAPPKSIQVRLAIVQGGKRSIRMLTLSAEPADIDREASQLMVF